MTLAHDISSRNRNRKWKLFLTEFPPSPSTTILDVGFSAREYSPVDNYIEKHYPYPSQLTALGIDPASDLSTRYPDIHAVSYDGHRFPFSDRQFDVVWSNAVLEHTGDADRQVLFLSEVTRVGRRAFITTPNRFFPVETHTRTPLLHYLPKALFDAYLIRTGRRWATGNYMHLLGEAQLRKRLAAAGIQRYRLIHNRLLGFTLDFVVII